MAVHVKNMTTGKPGKLILAFSLSLVAGNVFQQLYTVVDTMVVGKFLGVSALAALGASDWMNWLMLGVIRRRRSSGIRFSICGLCLRACRS